MVDPENREVWGFCGDLVDLAGLDANSLGECLREGSGARRSCASELELMLGDRGVVLRVRLLVDSSLAWDAAPKWSEGPEAKELEVAGVDGAWEPESVEPQDEAEAIWL